MSHNPVGLHGLLQGSLYLYLLSPDVGKYTAQIKLVINSYLKIVETLRAG
jgi:hypothetical protein